METSQPQLAGISPGKKKKQSETARLGSWFPVVCRVWLDNWFARRDVEASKMLEIPPDIAGWVHVHAAHGTGMDLVPLKSFRWFSGR